MSMVGSMAAMGHSVAGDEILKNSFANFAFENYEIAPTTPCSCSPRPERSTGQKALFSKT